MIDFDAFLNQKAKELEKVRLEKQKAYRKHKNTIGLAQTILKIIGIAIIPIAIFILPLGLVTLGCYILYKVLEDISNPKDEYVDFYKNTTLASIFKQLNPTYEYSPHHLNENNLIESKILKSSLLKNNSKLVGEDYIKGKIEDVDVECNELHFFRIEKNWGKFILMILFAVIAVPVLLIVGLVSGGGMEIAGIWFYIANEEILFFKGLLMTADFHKDFKGEIIMIPKNHKSISDALNLSYDTNLYHKVTLENENINKRYTIYATSEQEAYYILSTSMLQTIEDLSNNSKNLPLFSFNSGKMNLLIPKNHDSFEFILDEEITGPEKFSASIRDIKVLPTLIKHFKLNEKLWSK